MNGSIKDDNGQSIISLSFENYAALLPACLVISGAAIAAGIVMKSPELSPEFELTCLLAIFSASYVVRCCLDHVFQINLQSALTSAPAGALAGGIGAGASC